MARLPLITTSEQRSFKGCQRKHHFRYVQLREALYEHAIAAYEGTLGHCGLEHWLRAQKANGDQLDRALTMMREMWQESENPSEFTWEKMASLILGYHRRWKDAAIEVVAVEAEFRAPLLNPETGARSRTFDLGGKMDAVIRNVLSGDLLIMEHKFTSLDITAGSSYWKRLRMDDQISAYFDGARSLGYEVQGCLYDVIQRPGQKPKQATPEEDRKYTQPKVCPECKADALAIAKAEKVKLLVKDIPLTPGCEPCAASVHLYSNLREFDETPAEYSARIRETITENPDAYYQRGKVVRLQEELRDARFDVWSTAKQVHEATKSGRHVRNTASCEKFGSECQYFGVCSGEADINDPQKFTDREGKHSELEGQESEREGQTAA